MTAPASVWGLSPPILRAREPVLACARNLNRGLARTRPGASDPHGVAHVIGWRACTKSCSPSRQWDSRHLQPRGSPSPHLTPRGTARAASQGARPLLLDRAPQPPKAGRPPIPTPRADLGRSFPVFLQARARTRYWATCPARPGPGCALFVRRAGAPRPPLALMRSDSAAPALNSLLGADAPNRCGVSFPRFPRLRASLRLPKT